jgi:hypothetical protein
MLSKTDKNGNWDIKNINNPVYKKIEGYFYNTRVTGEY